MMFLEDIQDVSGKSGFVYAPFHRRTNFPLVFFEPEIIFTNDQIPTGLMEKLDRKQPLYPFIKQEEPKQITEEDYLPQVEKMIGAFNKSFSKAVLSRIRLVDKPPEFNVPEFYLSLTEKYPDAFCHLINIPGNGCWVGASPEILVRDDGEHVKTVALAGTMPISIDKPIVWNDKEKAEQEMVTTHIEEVLNRIGIFDFSRVGPNDYQAGQVVHRRTQFSFPNKALKGRLLELLSLLHPTPAVCGLPQDQALELLLDMEMHNREYYAGYCGPLNFQKKTDLFINLRCMKILTHKLALFIGGGITSLSDPAKEWEETQWKAETLLSII